MVVLPPRRPHHHQDPGEQGWPAQLMFARGVQVCMGDSYWNTWEEHESIRRPGESQLMFHAPGVACHQTSELPTVHYGLTGGWVQNFKPSYPPCFLQYAMLDQALGWCDHYIIR